MKMAVHMKMEVTRSSLPDQGNWIIRPCALISMNQWSQSLLTYGIDVGSIQAVHDCDCFSTIIINGWYMLAHGKVKSTRSGRPIAPHSDVKKVSRSHWWDRNTGLQSARIIIAAHTSQWSTSSREDLEHSIHWKCHTGKKRQVRS